MEVAENTGIVIEEGPIEVVSAGWAVTGVVRLLEVPNARDLFVQVEADGLTPGPHAWRLYNAGCEGGGTEVVAFDQGMAGMGVTLEANREGEATAIARIPATAVSREQIEAGSYSVRIHNGGGGMPGPAIACAEIS